MISSISIRVLIVAFMVYLGCSSTKEETPRMYDRLEIHHFLQKQSRILMDSAFDSFKEGAHEDTTHEFKGVYIMEDTSTSNYHYGKTIGFYRASEHLRKLADSVLYGEINLEIK